MVAAVLVMVLLAVVLAGAGALVVGIAERAADGRIGPNLWAGIRTSATKKSPEAWQRAHEVARPGSIRAGHWLTASGIGSLVLGVVIGFGEPDRTMAVWGVALTVGSLAATAVALRAAWHGHQAAKEI